MALLREAETDEEALAALRYVRSFIKVEFFRRAAQPAGARPSSPTRSDKARTRRCPPMLACRLACLACLLACVLASALFVSCWPHGACALWLLETSLKGSSRNAHHHRQVPDEKIHKDPPPAFGPRALTQSVTVFKTGTALPPSPPATAAADTPVGDLALEDEPQWEDEAYITDSSQFSNLDSQASALAPRA